MKEFSSLSALSEYVYNNDLYDTHKKITIIYSKDNWEKPFTKTQRTYETDTDQKYFNVNACGCSLFGNCLDGTDLGVRLDWYNWKAEKVILHI